MMDLEVTIRYYEKLEAWFPSYPGDPMVRPESHMFHIRCNSKELMEKWLENTPSVKAMFGGHHNGTFNGVFVNHEGYYEAVLKFKDKGEAALFKVAFG